MVTRVIQSVTVGDGLYRCTLWLKGRSIMYSCNHNILYFVWWHMCSYVHLWLLRHVAAFACLYDYIYIYLWVLVWLKMGESRMQDEHVSKSLWQFIHMLICAHFYVYKHIKEGQKLWSLWAQIPSHQHMHSLLVPTIYDTSTTMAFYSVNMHHCDNLVPATNLKSWMHADATHTCFLPTNCSCTTL